MAVYPVTSVHVSFSMCPFPPTKIPDKHGSTIFTEPD